MGNLLLEKKGAMYVHDGVGDQSAVHVKTGAGGAFVWVTRLEQMPSCGHRCQRADP